MPACNTLSLAHHHISLIIAAWPPVQLVNLFARQSALPFFCACARDRPFDSYHVLCFSSFKTLSACGLCARTHTALVLIEPDRRDSPVCRVILLPIYAFIKRTVLQGFWRLCGFPTDNSLPLCVCVHAHSFCSFISINASNSINMHIDHIIHVHCDVQSEQL